MAITVSHTYCTITAEGEVTSPEIVELQIVGGQAPYSCSWSDPVGISPVFSSDGCSFSLTESSFGSITYIVTDANGTTVTELVWAGCFYIDIGLGLNSDTNNQIEIQKKINSLNGEELKANSYKVYPNPFKEFTTLQIDLKETSMVSVELFDILGRKFKTIEANTKFEAGNHQIEIINELKSGGIILLKINIGDKQFIEKLIIE